MRETGFVTGCCMLIPTKVINTVGLMNEKFFLNFEDNEYSQRIKRAGHKLYVNCDTHIYHKVSSTQGMFYGNIQQYFFHRNRMIFFMEQLGGIKRWCFFITQFFIVIPGWLLFQLLRGHIKLFKIAFLAYVDYLCKKNGAGRLSSLLK